MASLPAETELSKQISKELKRAAANPLFRWRGGEVSRLEAFSDAVFALTLTLLVASTTAPKTFHQLWLTFRDLPVVPDHWR